MTLPSVAVSQAVLHALSQAALDAGEPISDAWQGMTLDLDRREAESLPLAVGLALAILAAEPPRLRLSADIAVAYDLYEVAPYLLALAGQGDGGNVWPALASLASHPGTDPAVGPQVERVTAQGSSSSALHRAIAIRLSPDAPTDSDLERRLHFESWPGLVPNDARLALAPIVGIADAELPKDFVWALMHQLRMAGASVRRIPARFSQPPRKGWLGPTNPIIATSPAVLTSLRSFGLQVGASQLVLADPGQVDERHKEALVRSVAGLIHRNGGSPLRVRVSAIAAVPRGVLARGVFTEGSYSAPEMAYLTGRRPSSVYRWSHKFEVLEPRRVTGLSYWTFSQVVALRTHHWFEQLTGRRISGRVVNALAEFAGRDEPGAVGVTAGGEVVVIDGEDAMHSMLSGQGVFPEVVRLDRTFQPFQLGGGNVVPGLLEPSPKTRVHPLILGGTPSLKGQRIACTTLARLAKAHTPRVIQAVYPHLTQEQVADALDIGNRILAIR